jgi:hypothetical protein
MCLLRWIPVFTGMTGLSIHQGFLAQMSGQLADLG